MSPAAPAWPAARAEQPSAVCTRCGWMSEPPAASFGRVAPTSAHASGDTDRRKHRPAEIRGRRRHGQRQLETQTAAEAERKERQRPRRRFRSRSEAVRKWPRGGAVPKAVPRRFRGSSEAARKRFRSNSEVVRFWGGSEAVRFRCVSEAGLTRSARAAYLRVPSCHVGRIRQSVQDASLKPFPTITRACDTDRDARGMHARAACPQDARPRWRDMADTCGGCAHGDTRPRAV